MKIELDDEQIDEVVIHSLKNTLANFEAELNDNNRVSGLFAHDLVEDIKIIKKHIKACKRLLEYYGGVL